MRFGFQVLQKKKNDKIFIKKIVKIWVRRSYLICTPLFRKHHQTRIKATSWSVKWESSNKVITKSLRFVTTASDCKDFSYNWIVMKTNKSDSKRILFYLLFLQNKSKYIIPLFEPLNFYWFQIKLYPIILYSIDVCWFFL